MDEVFRRLAAQLPKAWRLEGPRLASESGRGAYATREIMDFESDGVVDAWADIIAGDDRVTLAIEVRERFEPRDAMRILLAFERATKSIARVSERSEAPPARMIVSRYFSPRSRDLLTESGWNYADSTGNVRIASERPALFLKLTGSERDPAPEARPLQSLRGPVAGRIVRALLDRKPPYGIRELARQAVTSPAMVSRVVALLQRDAIVDKDSNGPILKLDWRALLQRWAQEYQFTRSNRVERYLALRGFGPMFEKLRATQRRYAITGPFVAERRRTLATSRLAMMYTDDVPALARELELGASAAVANVLLAEPGDEAVYQGRWEEEGLWYVAPSQAAADLLTSGDRNPRLAEALIEWMGENEDAWRS
ncbi:MAG: hypothetical protein HZA61_01795 [Candidatus Eisenbacteria bacterium]|uniref:HTH iclR-type domain-containing protein n=1 Tax=Eiseniibacteriota bacterium TaxID=2212470 RepID=A0A933SAH0_UNCEI|nr:hypothetical protein [Candidatus Eisenbacteria bacterium]